MKFVIADTHFSHNNIIKYCNRPFADAYEMNNKLVENWNNTVTDADEIYVLGDFVFGNFTKVSNIASMLNGKKYLIMGNHDRFSASEYVAAGFCWASPLPVILDEFYVLSHQPQYIQKNGVYINIFGHVHDNPMYNTISPRSYCVSVERINYQPISFDEVKTAISTVNEITKDIENNERA